MQVPEDGGVLAIDLEGIESFVTARIARRFEGRQRTIFEARQKRTRVIDANLFDLAGKLVRTLFNEGFSHGADLIDAAVEPNGSVDAMREQIACDAGAGGLNIQTP